MTRDELLAALENAEEPSRELDAEIAAAVSYVIPFSADDDGALLDGVLHRAFPANV